jgi:sugar/nucleoside kinase (ribokinase family)
MQNYDFLAVGDIVTEPFIRIDDAEVTCDADGEHCKLSLRFGDKVPYESVEILRAVGNSGNAAVSAARLGLNAGLLAYIGDDDIGRGDIEQLKIEKVSTDMIQTIAGMKSNYHYVLWHVPERTILVNHAEYPYKLDQNMAAPKWMYLSSLASNSAEYHDEIATYLAAHKEVKLIYQPGTFQMKLGIERTKTIYEHTEVFVCNFEEAQRILGTEEKDFKKLMDAIAALGPKIVSVTDGMKGAYARETDGTCWYMPIYPNSPSGPLERTGAGDSFTSTFAIALSLGKSVAEALTWAPINAMSVTEHVGAQKGLLTQAEIAEYLAKAPADYQPRKI